MAKTPNKSSSNGPVGKLIVIEGIDGIGKTTQIELLAKTLTSYDYDGLVFDFPQYSATSEVMLNKYQQGKYGDLNPQAASTLFTIDRFDVSNNMREHLSDGKIILANRYTPSNAAYQGAKISDREERIKFYKWLDHLEYTIFNLPKPDLTLILHIPTEHTPDNLKSIQQTYFEVANLFPNTKLIECSDDAGHRLSPQEIQAKIWELIRRMVLKNNSF